MSFLYKTFYLPENPKAEYQKHGKTWVKRLKGAKTDFYPVDDNGQNILNKKYTGGMLYFISDTVKIGSVLLLGTVGYFLFFKKYGAKPNGVKPNGITNKPQITNVSGK